MTPSADRRAEGARAVPTAAELWGRARGSVDLGRPGTGYRLGSRALTHLGREHLPGAMAAALRARILITMADAKVELGEVEQAASLLDAALQVSPDVAAIVKASRGVLLARTGRLDASREHLDAAVAGGARCGGARPNHGRGPRGGGRLAAQPRPGPALAGPAAPERSPLGTGNRGL